MKPRIGFSTGAITKGDFRAGLQTLVRHGIPIVEISTLRDTELRPFLDALPSLHLSTFTYIAFHAPSRLQTIREEEAVDLLAGIADLGWPIIVHPDAVSTPSIWRRFGPAICIENMDRRKPIGRTVAELDAVFAELPDASFCFDIGHARQIDPTMGEADRMLRRFRHRLRQIHISEVNAHCEHEAISPNAIADFRTVLSSILPETPFIIESPVPEASIDDEIAAVIELCRDRTEDLSRS